MLIALRPAPLSASLAGNLGAHNIDARQIDVGTTGEHFV